MSGKSSLFDEDSKKRPCCELFEIPYYFKFHSLCNADKELHEFNEMGCSTKRCCYLIQIMINFLIFSVMIVAIVCTCTDAVRYMQTENLQRRIFFKDSNDLWVKIAKLDSEMEGDRCSLNSEWKLCKHNEMCENPQECEKFDLKFKKKQEEQEKQRERRKKEREEKEKLAKEKANAQKDTTNKNASNTAKQNTSNTSNSSLKPLNETKALPNVNLFNGKSQPETTNEDSMKTLKIAGICAGIVFLVLLAAALIFLKIFYLPTRNENNSDPGFLNKEHISHKNFILLPDLPPSDEKDPGDMHEIEFLPKAII